MDAHAVHQQVLLSLDLGVKLLHPLAQIRRIEFGPLHAFGFERGEPRELFARLVQLRNVGAHLRQARPGVEDVGFEPLGSLPQLAFFALQKLDAPVLPLDLGPELVKPFLQRCDLAVEHQPRRAALLAFRLPRPDGCRQRRNPVLDGVRLGAQRGDFPFQPLLADGRPTKLPFLQLFLEIAVTLRLLRLKLDPVKLPLHLPEDVVDPQEILPGLFHLPLRRLPAALESARARRLFDDATAVLRLGVHQLLDTSLPDDGVRLVADTRPREQLDDLTQAAGHPVDGIFRLAGAKDPPGHGDLGESAVVGGGRVVGVVQQRGDLRHADGGQLLAAAEDDVLHGLAAEVPGALLAHGPTQRVDDVGFSATVGPHDGGDVGGEVEDGLVRERLEPGNFQSLQPHTMSPRRGGVHAVRNTDKTPVPLPMQGVHTILLHRRGRCQANFTT